MSLLRKRHGIGVSNNSLFHNSLVNSLDKGPHTWPGAMAAAGVLLEPQQGARPFKVTAELSGNVLKNVSLSSDVWDLTKELRSQDQGQVLQALGEFVLEKVVESKPWLDHFGELYLRVESWPAALLRSNGKLMPWQHQLCGKWWCHWQVKQLFGADHVVLRCPACAAAGVSENKIESMGRTQQPRTVRGLLGEGFLSAHKYRCKNKGEQALAAGHPCSDAPCACPFEATSHASLQGLTVLGSTSYLLMLLWHACRPPSRS